MRSPRVAVTGPGVPPLSYGCRDGKCAGDRGSTAGDVQPGVDVFQVLAHSSLGQAQVAGDLGVGAPSGHQAQQFPLAGGQFGGASAALLGLKVGLVQVRAQQREQGTVAFGEVRSWPAGQEQPCALPTALPSRSRKSS